MLPNTKSRITEVKRIYVYALLYGDDRFSNIHSRLLGSWNKYDPKGWCTSDGKDESTGTQLVRRVIWANPDMDTGRFSPVTKLRLRLFNEPMYKTSVILANSNTPKYVAMREMFSSHKPEWTKEDWIIWYDDDSYLCGDDFRKKTLVLTKDSGAVYIGQPWYVEWLPGQKEWFYSQPWWNNLPPEIGRSGKPITHFAQGAFWLLRGDVAKKLDWPLNLNHNGGDVALGEAVRQAGYPFTKLVRSVQWGVVINDATRRGYHEAPAGCTNRSIRR